MAQPTIPDTESLGWQRALSGTGSGRQHALVRLHALLLHAARFEVARRRRTVDEDLDDLALQAADDALRAILSRLHTYHGDTRFTTWAYKFALHEAAVKVREHRGLGIGVGKTRPIEDANLSMRQRRTIEPPAPLDPVAEWRRRCLLAAGFASDLAAHLAENCAVDLHAVLELIDRGCPPELAARILAPLDDRRRPC
jgi:hypothetical protein